MNLPGSESFLDTSSECSRETDQEEYANYEYDPQGHTEIKCL